jgi:hypothetical protein
LIVYGFIIWITHSESHTAFNHRDKLNHLIQAEMIRLKCTTKFRIFEPLEDYRVSCPYILIVVKGPHSHPVPLPKHTPPFIRADVLNLLENLNEDLPDITPRSFLRHNIVQCYLRTRLPTVSNPTLSDIHISLANRSHLQVYIDQAISKCFPAGTGWEGERIDTPFC